MGPTFVSGGVRVSALQSSQISRVLQDWSEEDIEKSFHYSPRYCQLSLLILIYFFDAINELEFFLLKKVCPRCHHRDRADMIPRRWTCTHTRASTASEIVKSNELHWVIQELTWGAWLVFVGGGEEKNLWIISWEKFFEASTSPHYPHYKYWTPRRDTVFFLFGAHDRDMWWGDGSDDAPIFNYTSPYLWSE